MNVCNGDIFTHLNFLQPFLLDLLARTGRRDIQTTAIRNAHYGGRVIFYV